MGFMSYLNPNSTGSRFRVRFVSIPVIACCLAFGAPDAVSRAEAAPAEHEAAACSACHGAGGAGLAGNDADVERTCLTCHEPQLRRGNLAMHTEASGNCLNCHSFHAESAGSSPAAEAQFAAFESNAVSDHCTGCHAEGGALSKLSPGHRVAAELYHRDRQTLRNLSPSEACLLCHGDSPSAAWTRGLDTEPIPLNRHASHPFGVVLRPGDRTEGMPVRSVADPRIPLFSGRMECTSCHLVSVGQDDLLRPFPAKYDLCLGCHVRGGEDLNDPGSLPVAWAGADH